MSPVNQQHMDCHHQPRPPPSSSAPTSDSSSSTMSSRRPMTRRGRSRLISPAIVFCSNTQLIQVSLLLLLLLFKYPSAISAAPSGEKQLECGRQLIRNGRIVGGDDAYEGEFPWAISIRLNGQHYCGGVLLNSKWILTAAHCVVGYVPRNFWVRLGAHKARLQVSPNEQDIPVNSMIIHQNYSRPRPFANDIALLKLQDDVVYSEYVAPICLPNKGDPEDGDFYEGTKGIVVGWGWLRDDNEPVGRGGGPADILQKVNLPVLPNDKCSHWYQSQGKHVVVSSQQFCAGFREGKKDACRGDSGGPMLVKSATTNKYTVVGIVSAGIGCAQKELPGLYTRVNAYIPWIEKYIGAS